MSGRVGATLVIVLHGHLPAVVGHGTWPHGSVWLLEAAAETYIPFLGMARRLLEDGVPIRLTVGLTPVLCEQLADPRFVRELRRYLGERARAAARDAGEIRRDGEGSEALAVAWHARYLALLEEFDGPLGRDIVGGFRSLAESGVIELISSAATHALLPLLPDETSIARQLDVGLACHLRHFGRPPRGLWLPECAWYGAGGAAVPGRRHPNEDRGLAALLLERDIRFTFLETHLVTGGEGPGVYGGSGGYGSRRASLPLREGRSPYQPYLVARTGGRLAVFGRDPRGSEQVWSGLVGYPGDEAYLEFHKRRSRGGLRYWRVTDSAGSLHEKALYDPGAVRQRLVSHARHFCQLIADLPRRPDGGNPVAAAMFDLELFGHWWFEGIEWLEEVFRTRARDHPEVVVVSASEALASSPPAEELSPPAGTWGKGGDFRVWWNEETRDYWRKVEEANRLLREISASDRELLPAALGQTLLLQASDWPFLIEGGAAQDYALRRVRGHHGNLRTLAAIARRRGLRRSADEVFLAGLARQDALFGRELAAAAARESVQETAT